MKTGLGLRRKIRKLFTWWTFYQFQWKKKVLGFDVANQFLQKVDKQSIQLILRKNGATIGKDCDIETGLIFHNCKNYSNLIIGDNCHVGKNCFFDLRDKVIIGDNVVISMQCTFLTHIDMNKSPLRSIYPAKSSPVTINDNSYIGARTTIMKGVQIGKNVIIATGSVINKDIKDECVVGGVPAKFIKKLN